MITTLGPKTEPGPESSLKEFPLLYLYFDDFLELQKAAKQGAFEIGMIRSHEGTGAYRFEGVLTEEERFLDFYRNGMLRLKLHDGTILSRKQEKEYWDRVENPENYEEKPVVNPDIHARARAELEADLKSIDEEINSIVNAIKLRYGM